MERGAGAGGRVTTFPGRYSLPNRPMGILTTIWLVGGVICSLLYLIAIIPDFVKNSKMSGVRFELFHYGMLTATVFLLWPVVVTGLLWEWLRSR
jgi:hypothetical protein